MPVPHFSTYLTPGGKEGGRIVVELSPSPQVTRLEKGDFVEVDLELVMFPAMPSDYYGPNRSFREALEKAPDSWQLIAREAKGNELLASASRGGSYALTRCRSPLRANAPALPFGEVLATCRSLSRR